MTNDPVAGFLTYDRLAAGRPDMIRLRVMGWPDKRPKLAGVAAWAEKPAQHANAARRSDCLTIKLPCV